MKKNFTVKPLYGVLVLFTASVCCFIAVLSLLSCLRSVNEETLSEKRAEAASCYYRAVSEANEIIISVNEGTLSLEKTDAFTLKNDSVSDTVEFYTKVNENSRLLSVCEVKDGKITKILLRKITD